jgi:VanZ family protein
MQRIFQAVPWLFAVAIVVLSLGPPSVRPSTGAAHDLEHLWMFLATGVAFGFGYPHRLWLLAIAQVIFAAAIEVAQNWIPGRHARISDFLVDAAASCLGVGLSCLLFKFGAGPFRRRTVLPKLSHSPRQSSLAFLRKAERSNGNHSA